MQSRSVLFFVLICIFGAFSVTGQPDSSYSKARYFNAFHAGGLLAKKGHGTALSVSSIHGIRKNRVALGLGIGYDAYLDWRTLPLFGSVSYDFGVLPKGAFFLQFNAGYSIGWVPETDMSWVVYDGDGGRVIHPRVGYRIHANQFSLYLTAGYQWQKLKYEEKIRDWFNPNNKVTIERELQRISIQLGFGLH